jgi:hypothetical protein
VLPARERVQGPRGEIADPDLVERLAATAPVVLRRPAHGAEQRGPPHEDDVEHGERPALIESVALGHVADARRSSLREHAATAQQGQEAEQRLQQGGLARAVRAEHPQGCARADGEIDRREEGHAVADDRVFEADEVHGCGTA